MLKKKINFDKIEKQLIDNKIKKLRLLGGDLIEGIVKRTTSGKDKNLKSFKGDRKITLRDTGQMLGALQSKDVTRGVGFYFINTKYPKKGNQKKSSTTHEVVRANLRRGFDFFGMDKKQIKLIKKRLSNE